MAKYEVVSASSGDVAGTVMLVDGVAEVVADSAELDTLLRHAVAGPLQLRDGDSKDGVSWSGVTEVSLGDPDFPSALDEHLHGWDYILRKV